VLTAAVVAAFGVPFRSYQCWFSWAWLPTNLGMMIYFTVAAGGGGLLAWVAAEATQVHPSSNALVNGILYGLIAGAVLRVDFGARPRENHSRHYREAASILTKCLTWLSGSLDDIAYRRAERWLQGRSDEQLLDEVFRVKAHIDHKPASEVTKRQRDDIYTRLIAAMELLPQPTRRAEGRAHLVTFCAKYYIKEHLPKISVINDPATQVERAAQRPRWSQ
jgi:hypothetical protein